MKKYFRAAFKRRKTGIKPAFRRSILIDLHVLFDPKSPSLLSGKNVPTKYIRMYRTFADSEMLSRSAYSGAVLHDINRQIAGALFNIGFQISSLHFRHLHA